MKKYKSSSSKKIVGITGGIGSGKTFVCQILESMSYPVFYSDKEAKWLLVNDTDVKGQVIELFGEEAYFDGGILNREFLASKIFEDKKMLTQMNAIVHPAVKQHFLNWVDQQNSKIVFNEAAIIFEIGNSKNYEKIILVKASKATKIKRIQKRDSSSLIDIEKRMNNQWTDEKKTELADFCIINDEGTMLLPQINAILNALNE